MTAILSGGCLCQGVAFEVGGPLFMGAYCHCSMCRRAHAAASRPGALGRSEHFRWTRGETLLSDYVSSPGIHRFFCGRCGSHLVARADARPDLVNIALGALDDESAARPLAHWHVGSKAAWHDIADGLPQHSGFPGSS